MGTMQEEFITAYRYVVKKYSKYPLHSTNYEYVSFVEYRIPNDMLGLLHMLGVKSLEQYGRIYKLYARPFVVNLDINCVLPMHMHVITLNGFSMYNVLDWIQFADEEIDANGGDQVIYYFNCNRQSEYFGNIMYEYHSTYTVVGSLMKFLNSVVNWIKYTPAKPKNTMESMLDEDSTLVMLDLDLRKAGFKYDRITYGVLLHHTHTPRGLVEPFTLDMLKKARRQGYERIEYQYIHVLIRGVSDGEVMSYIDKIRNRLSHMPLFDEDNKEFILGNMYEQCVYEDPRAARFSAWFIKN